MKKLYMLLLAVAVCVAGCQKEDVPNLSVEKDLVEIDAEGGTVNVAVKCAVKSFSTLVYNEGEDWIQMLPRALWGDGILTFMIKEYEGVFTNRTATVTVVAGTESKTIQIVQKRASKVGLELKAVSIAHAGGSLNVNVEANVAWNAVVTSGADWITLTKSTGNEGAEAMSFTVAEATELAAYGLRAGTIKVTAGQLEAELKVYQGFGTVIGNLLWASSNVDQAETFAASPDAPGCFFQYDSNVAIPASGSIPAEIQVSWPGQADKAGIQDWSEEHDPCPDGWRVPSFDEIKSLTGFGDGNRYAVRTAEQTGFAVDGAMIGQVASIASQATKADMKGCIFMPQTGYRSCDDGSIQAPTRVTLQCRTRPGQTWDRHQIGINAGGDIFTWSGYPDGSNFSAHVIRCVKEIPEL